MTTKRFANLPTPDLAIYIEDGRVTLQHFDGAFSLHLRMTSDEAYDLSQTLLAASFAAAEQKEAA